MLSRENDYPLICRSKKTIEASVAKILGISCIRLRQWLSIDYIQQYEDMEHHETDFCEYLYNEFLSKNRIVPNTITRIHWFHGTRCFPEADFLHEGILPLGMVMNQIFDKIDIIAKNSGIMAKTTDNKFYSHYINLLDKKTGNQSHWGPHAMLMKEALIAAEGFSCHNYLVLPEIIEDYIYSKYPLSYDLLHDIFVKATRACIVEFWTPSLNRQKDTLKMAMNYLYRFSHNDSFSYGCNTCFDGKGELIPAAQIVNVEYLDRYKH